MTAAVWIASPPELHAALLNSGPGAGPLLAAAGEWRTLSLHYAAAAADLTAVLSMIESGAWGGMAAHRYLGAHAAYLQWLAQAGSDSAAVAVQIEAAASSYAAALVAMPTPAELAANHAAHAALVATNFFGINTIPIVLNEADYTRMWLQAAATMTTYDAVTAAARAAAPSTEPAPSLLAADTRAAANPSAAHPRSGWALHDPIEDLLAGSEHFLSMYKMLKRVVSDPLGTLYQIIVDFAADPSAALVTWQPLLYLFAYAAVFAVLGTPLYAAILVPTAAAGLAGLAGLAAVAGPAEAAVTPTGRLPVQAGDDRAAVVAPPAPAGISGSAPAPAQTAASGPPVQVTTPAAGGAEVLGHLVCGGGPGARFGPSIGQRTGAEAQAPRAAAAAVAAAGRGQRRSGNRCGAAAAGRSHRYEFVTMDAVSPPPHSEEPVATASARGAAGTLGFAGAVPKTAADPVGMLTRVEDSGSGRAAPLIPGTWNPHGLQR